MTIAVTMVENIFLVYIDLYSFISLVGKLSCELHDKTFALIPLKILRIQFIESQYMFAQIMARR